MDERIRTGVPVWVVVFVALGGLFWGGVAGAVLAVVVQDADHRGFGEADESELDLITVGPGGKLEAFDAEIGTCLTATVDADRATVTDIGSEVDCAQRHDAEVFARVDLPVPVDGSPYDGYGVDATAYNLCTLLLPEGTGQVYEDSPFEVSAVGPTGGAWERGARTISCLIHDPEGEPLRNSSTRPRD